MADPQLRNHVLRALRSAMLVGLWVSSGAQAADNVRLQRSVPAGFDDLTAPHRQQVGVIFNKIQIGKVDSVVDLESITFADAAAVAALVPNLGDRSKVAAALAGPLALHAQLVCSELARTGCGQLAPEVAGVIYDSSSETVRLFVNPALRVWSASLERIQPHESTPALLGKVNLNISGQSTSSEPVYALGLNTIAGVGATHVRIQGLLHSGRGDLLQLHLRHVADGHEQVAGLFNAGYGPFLPPQRLLGLRFGTTLDDLPADAGAYDVPIIVGLTTPATIDVIVGASLVASARYPAGDARIDTSAFPTGAYLVKLRIVEAGRERIEERFFARSSAFPPLGAPQTSIALGVRYAGIGFAATGSDEQTPALQVTHRRRLSHHFGLGSSLYAREDAFAAEAELGLSFDRLQWSNSILGSSAGEFASASSLRLQTSRWRLLGDVRRIVTSGVPRILSEPRFLSISESFWQTTLTAGRRFGGAQLQAVALWRRGASGSESWSVQPSLELPLRIAGRQLGVRLTGDFSPDRSGVRLEFGTRSTGQTLDARAGAQVLQQGSQSRFSPIYEAGVSGQRRFTPEAHVQTDLTWRQDERETLTGAAQLRTGQGSAFLSLQSDLESHQQNYLGNLQSGFAWTRTGFALTSAAPGDAAIVYVNKTQSGEAAADALLANARIATVDPQRSRVQPVAAFRRSAVGMLPSRGAALGGGSPSREATLFPGTVAIVAADFIQVTAAFGQLIDVAGAPVGRAVLRGANGIGESDASGYFQIDVAANKDAIAVRRSNGTTCNFELAAPTGNNSVFDAGQIVCR